MRPGGSEGGDGARQERPPVRRALSKLSGFFDFPTAVASFVAAPLIPVFFMTGAFYDVSWSLGTSIKSFGPSDVVRWLYLSLALLLLFAPLAVGWGPRRLRPKRAGTVVAWAVCMPASLALPWVLYYSIPPIAPIVDFPFNALASLLDGAAHAVVHALSLGWLA